MKNQQTENQHVTIMPSGTPFLMAVTALLREEIPFEAFGKYDEMPDEVRQLTLDEAALDEAMQEAASCVTRGAGDDVCAIRCKLPTSSLLTHMRQSWRKMRPDLCKFPVGGYRDRETSALTTVVAETSVARDAQAFLKTYGVPVDVWSYGVVRKGFAPLDANTFAIKAQKSMPHAESQLPYLALVESPLDDEGIRKAALEQRRLSDLEGWADATTTRLLNQRPHDLKSAGFIPTDEA